MAHIEKEKAEALLEVERQKADNEIKLEHVEHTHALELLDLKLKGGVGVVEKSVQKPKGPKIPTFEEGKYEMDSYLHRFEGYALAQSWNKDLWATHLSALLKGKVLDVYALLPFDQALDYDALKMTLLKRYELTEDGFKRKFRSCRPELGETFGQFSVRMSSYLIKWIEMANTPTMYEGLFDLMMRDQLLHICNRELALFLKERTPISLPQMATIAEQYKEAILTSALNLTFPQGLDKKNPRHKSTNERVDTGKTFTLRKRLRVKFNFYGTTFY